MVQAGQILKVEKLDGAKEGGVVSFDKVLLLIEGEEIKLGKPYLEGVKVSAEVKKEGRAEKVTVLRYKRKTRSRKKKVSPAVYGSNNPRNKITSENITRWLLFSSLSLKYYSSS